MQKIEIKDCAFCGSRGFLDYNVRGHIEGRATKVVYVYCRKCHARSGKYEITDDMEERRRNTVKAIKAWNKRHDEEEGIKIGAERARDVITAWLELKHPAAAQELQEADLSAEGL